MNQNQRKILDLSHIKDITSMPLRKIAEEAGLNSEEKKVSPQTVKYHLSKLIEKGLILKKEGKNKTPQTESLFRLPILAKADCGSATQIAKENLEGYLKVSPKSIERSSANGLIVVRAVGSSMNRANIGGKSINEDDYVIVDCNNKNPQNGQYVLSIIDEVTNIKRFFRDGNEIRLVSESNIDISPIVIHQEDNYMIGGVILKVVKKD
jgi:SOS-response transcriptional repressor LexA